MKARHIFLGIGVILVALVVSDYIITDTDEQFEKDLIATVEKSKTTVQLCCHELAPVTGVQYVSLVSKKMKLFMYSIG